MRHEDACVCLLWLNFLCGLFLVAKVAVRFIFQEESSRLTMEKGRQLRREGNNGTTIKVEKGGGKEDVCIKGRERRGKRGDMHKSKTMRKGSIVKIEKSGGR